PRVDLRADFIFAAITRLGRLLNGVLHRGKHERAVDRLFARHGIRNLQKLQPVRANPLLRHLPTPPLPSPLPRPISGPPPWRVRGRRVSVHPSKPVSPRE